MYWSEIARVLRRGGTYFAQHVGPGTVRELAEYFLGPGDGAADKRRLDVENEQAKAAGLQVVEQRLERLRAECFDVGAVIYFLRKVIWPVPDFTVDRYRERLRDLHDRIQRDGSFVTYSTRVLVEARKRPGDERSAGAAISSRHATRPARAAGRADRG